MDFTSLYMLSSTNELHKKMNRMRNFRRGKKLMNPKVIEYIWIFLQGKRNIECRTRHLIILCKNGNFRLALDNLTMLRSAIFVFMTFKFNNRNCEISFVKADFSAVKIIGVFEELIIIEINLFFGFCLTFLFPNLVGFANFLVF